VCCVLCAAAACAAIYDAEYAWPEHFAAEGASVQVRGVLRMPCSAAAWQSAAVGIHVGAPGASRMPCMACRRSACANAGFPSFRSSPRTQVTVKISELRNVHQAAMLLFFAAGEAADARPDGQDATLPGETSCVKLAVELHQVRQLSTACPLEPWAS